MARLDLFRAGARAKSIHLHAERAWMVGRDPSADLVLKDDLASRRHFKIVAGDEGWRLEDLDTPNGTLVNGVREFSRDLATACTLQVGREIMIFDPDAASDAEPDDTLPAWALSVLGEEQQDMPSTCLMAPAKMRHVQAQERVRTRPHLAAADRTGRLWPLDNKINTVGLGKVQIALGEAPKGKAKVLAQITREGDGAYIVKAQGLFAKVKVNGTAARQHKLAPGDRLELHGVQIHFFEGLRGREAS